MSAVTAQNCDLTPCVIRPAPSVCLSESLTSYPFPRVIWSRLWQTNRALDSAQMYEIETGAITCSGDSRNEICNSAKVVLEGDDPAVKKSRSSLSRFRNLIVAL